MTQQSQKQMRQEEWAVPSNHLENNLVRALLCGSAVPEAPLALPAPTQVQDQRGPWTAQLPWFNVCPRAGGRAHRKFTARTPTRPRDPRGQVTH